MDSLAEKYKNGLIGRNAYCKAAMDKTIGILNSTPFQYVKTLGQGTFGCVVEVKCPEPQVKMAAKIVLRDRILENERLVWPSLEHPNILRLIAQDYLPDAHTHVFFMRMHPTSLELMFDNFSFLSDTNGFERALSWLGDVLSGVSYLHRQGLCHLDLKCDNVLISEADTAIVCDFGFVTSAVEGPVDSYGSPFIYRPPEAEDSSCGLAEVDGFNFDIWTLGTLVVELFTRQIIYRTASNSVLEFNDWATHMYPTLFDTLQERKFSELMRNAFPSSDSIKSRKNRKTASMVIANFISSCLDLNPANRPGASEATNHLLFGGGVVFSHDKKSIWSQKASPFKVNLLLQVYRSRKEVKCCPITSYASVTARSGDTSSFVKDFLNDVMYTDAVANEESMKNDENIDVENKTLLTANPESVSSGDRSLAVDDDIEPGEIIFDEDGNYTADVNFSQDVLEVNIPAGADSKRSSNSGAKGTVFGVESSSPAAKNSETEEIIGNNYEVEATVSRCQKLRNWAKKRKHALQRIFKSCLPPFRCRKT